jgi:hypothetical protein
MAIILTEHAGETVQKPAIAMSWVEATITAPDRAGPDPRHPERTRSYKTIAEFGSRVLRVVHRPEGDDVVVTVHFEREVRQ